MPHKLDIEARQQIGTRTGQFGAVGLHRGTVGAHIGAALQHLQRLLAAGCGGQIGQHIGANIGQGEVLRDLAGEHGQYAGVGIGLRLQGGLLCLQCAHFGGNVAHIVVAGLPGMKAPLAVAVQLLQGGDAVLAAADALL